VSERTIKPTLERVMVAADRQARHPMDEGYARGYRDAIVHVLGYIESGKQPCQAFWPSPEAGRKVIPIG
jgi:hypothetical protein